jgi:hypothetical protein
MFLLRGLFFYKGRFLFFLKVRVVSKIYCYGVRVDVGRPPID